MNKTNAWLSLMLAFCVPSVLAAQEGDTYTLQAIDDANSILKAQWMDLRVEQIQMLSVGTAQAGARLHRLPYHWVAADSRRGATGSNLTYLVDNSPELAPAGLSPADAQAAIGQAVATWSADCCLRKVGVSARPYTGADPDIFDAQLGFGGFGDWRAADVVVGGWMPPAFFDAVAADGGHSVLALSVTFIFVGSDGQPTDVDHDGAMDTASSEIFFNRGFDWSVDGSGGFDVRTVALHELGHSLGIAHIASPPGVVMNPVYGGLRTSLLPPDHGALCSIWGNWAH